MKHLFLSDVHLGAFSDQKNDRLESELIDLVRFSIEEKIQLHILGDLFDYWMEFGNEVPKIGRRLLHQFSEYNHSFRPATYITGNHDNWTQGYFEKLGFDVLTDYKSLNIDSLKVFLHHGDGLNDSKLGLERPFFHRILRHPAFTRTYQFIFGAESGIDLMRQFSSYSRNNPDQDPERLNKWSQQFLKESDYDYIICGHDHLPRVETFSFGTYINLGTFFEEKTVALYTNNGIELVRWNADERRFDNLNDLHTEI